MIRSLKKKYFSLPLPIRISMLYMFCSVLEKGISFIAVPIYTRLVPSEQYGYYSVFQSWETVLLIFATLNLSNYVYSKGMLKYEENKEQFTSALIGLSGLSTLLLFLVYFPMRDWFEEISGLNFGLMCLMFLVFVFEPSYRYWCARQRFEYSIKGFLFTSILIALLSPVVSISAIATAKTLGCEDLGTVLITCKVLVPVSVYIFVCFLHIKRCRILYDREVWSYALRFNLPVIPHFLSSVILRQSDRIMIGRLCGNSDAGIYSVAYSSAAIMTIVNQALMDSLIPWMYKKMRDKNYAGIAGVASGSLLLIAGINIMLAMVAPEVISIMAPAEYQQAIYVIPPVAISNVFIYMFNLYANIEYYFEETRFVTLASITSAVINVILNYFFIRKYGFIAAGYTTVVCYILYALGHYSFMRVVLKKYKIMERIYDIKQIWGIGFIAVLLALATVIIYPYPFIRVLFVTAMLTVLLLKRKKVIVMLADIRKIRK